MPIVSIVLFVVSGSLLIYAGITALTKRIAVPITMSASVKHVTKEYAVRFAKLIAFLSLAPFVGGVCGLFIELVLIPIIIFFVLFIVLLIVGIKIIMNNDSSNNG